MANEQDVLEVINWEGMEAYHAPLGTAAETDLATPLTAAWLGLGVVTTDSGAQEISSDTTKYEVRGKSGVTTATQTTKLGDRTIAIALAQQSKEVDAFLFPENSITAGTGVNTTITTLSDAGIDGPFAMCLVRYSGSTLVERIFITKAQKSITGLPNLFGDEPGANEITVTVFRQADQSWGTRVSNNPAYSA